ncbi:hypothetical protein MMC22_009035 [Lobaria immixta]|nr:hypothetical protein [Lobaria immixta]
MDWRRVLHLQDENTRRKWGYQFQWTENHLTADQTNPLRFSYDRLGAEALERLRLIQNSTTISGQDTKASKPRLDLYDLLRENYNNDQILGQLWKEINTVPDWVDWAQLARGQEVFYRYAAPAMAGFVLQGFIGENATTGGTAETLVRTGGFSTKVLRHRLFETFQWLLQCTKSLEHIKPGGAGHASTVRVRLLHSSVRQRIMKITESRPEYYDANKHGVPANDLDSVHAISIFCASPMWYHLPRQGVFPREQEIVDYIALFRYVAYLIGTPTAKYFETPTQAKALMESLMLTELATSETSKVVASNFIKAIRDTPPVYVSKEFIEAGSRWMCGDEVCDELGLGRPGYYSWAVVFGLCWLSMAVCYTVRAVPYLDRKMIAFLRPLIYDYIVESKGGLGGASRFNFKYIPGADKKTGNEDAPPVKSETPRILERYCFGAFIVGCVLFSLAAFCGVRMALYLPSVSRAAWAMI